jgi:type II secretion system protein G
MRAPKAFTLIELLIVVAIIAILAAIAVPNFLEAQVRSKVARVKADMRSLATGIESYAVDNNLYPIASQWVAVFNRFNARMHGLTTPIAYMSSLPADTFRRSENTFPITAGETPTFEYTDFSTGIQGANYPGTLSYNLFQNQAAFDQFYLLRNGAGLKWVLVSVGPDRNSDFQQIAAQITEAQSITLGANSAYDPTNGTVSRGDVVRTQAAQRN